jgi:methyltransferase family protein
VQDCSVAEWQDHMSGTARRAHKLVERTRRVIKGTPLERPAVKLANWVRTVIAPTADPDAWPESIAPPMWVEPGHFFSPVPSIADIEALRGTLDRAPPASLPGIELRLEEQRGLLEKFRGFYDEQPFAAERGHTTRYWFENPSFGYADALALYSMLRYLEPNHILEVGAGPSSCVILDTCERFLDWGPRHTLIEPYPVHLLSLFRVGDLDRVHLLDKKVQDVPVAQFQELGANDILFIDSTHVSKLNSDVNYVFFEIFPALQPGVYVHLHDIFYPFEYPLGWAEEGRGWNEAYLLRAYLANNDEFEIVLFNNLIWQHFEDVLDRDFPLWLRNPGASIWLRKH